MATAKILSIGSQVNHSEENLLILFGTKITEGLSHYAVVQEFIEGQAKIRPQMELIFGDQVYHVEKVGRAVQHNMHELEHVNISFNPYDDEHIIESMIYVTPYQFPKLTEGMLIIYKD